MRRALATALACALSVGASEVRADEPPPVPTDVKWGTGVATASVGAVFIASGAMSLAESGVAVPCELPPCYDFDGGAGGRAAGVAMFAGGIGMTGFGLMYSYLGEAEEGRHVPRSSNAMMGAGMFITAVGVGGIVGAQTLWSWGAYEDDDYIAVAPLMLLTSGSLLSLGVPLWLGGASAPDQDGPVFGPGTVRRSPALLTGGIVMTALGAVTIGSGVGMAVDLGNDGGDLDDDAAPFFAVGSVMAGGTLLATGLSLLVKGNARVHPTRAFAGVVDFGLPSVSVSANSASLHWSGTLR